MKFLFSHGINILKIFSSYSISKRLKHGKKESLILNRYDEKQQYPRLVKPTCTYISSLSCEQNANVTDI